MPTANSIMYLDALTYQVNILNSSGTPSNYQLAYGSWQPGVAQRQKRLISGNTAYAPVLEEMVLNIKGATAADAISNLQTLYKTLDRANRWYDEEYISEVFIVYQPKGSNLTNPLRALVLANATDEDVLSLPALYDDVGSVYYISGVKIRFWRVGVWLGDIDTATSAATANGSVGTVTLTGSNGISAPTDLVMADFNTASMPVAIPDSVLFVADANEAGTTSRIATVAASSMVAGSPAQYTSVNESANNAKNTTVLRFTPTNTSFVVSFPVSLPTIHGRLIAIYATIRNNSGTTTFRVKCANAVSQNGMANETRETFIDTTANPRVVFLGVLQRIIDTASIFYISIAGSAASGSLDIDQIVLCSIDDETSSIIELGDFNVSNEVGTGVTQVNVTHNLGTTSPPQFNVKPTQPTVYLSNSTFSNYGPASPYVGLTPVQTRFNVKKWLWLATNGGTRWVYVNNVNAIVSFTLQAKRQRAYIVPE